MGKKKPAGEITVAETWKRIDEWLAQHAPEQAASLAKGAKADQIKQLERQLNMKLPQEFVESYAIHDGQKEDCDLIPDDFGTFYLLRLKDIPKQWKVWNQLNDNGEFAENTATPDKGVAADWWNRGWIPFASDGGGDHLCIDLAPAKGGKVGQVIQMCHDQSDRKLIAPSFAAWLIQLAESLERGDLDLFLE